MVKLPVLPYSNVRDSGCFVITGVPAGIGVHFAVKLLSPVSVDEIAVTLLPSVSSVLYQPAKLYPVLLGVGSVTLVP